VHICVCARACVCVHANVHGSKGRTNKDSAAGSVRIRVARVRARGEVTGKGSKNPPTDYEVSLKCSGREKGDIRGRMREKKK
jgi:hypothetical protein